MGRIEKSPAPLVESAIEAKHDNQRGLEKSSTNPEKQGAVRGVFLAECRAAELRSRLAATDIEAVGIALRHGLINVEQAMELLDARDALDWLNLERRAAP